jgi:hypothetical protein
MPDDDVLKLADALMGRHRSFVARTPEPASAVTDEMPAPASAPPAVLPQTSSASDAEIPLLTDIIDCDPVVEADEQMRQLLDATCQRWLAEALPARVDALKESLRAQLHSALQDEMRQSLLPSLIATLNQRGKPPQT